MTIGRGTSQVGLGSLDFSRRRGAARILQKNAAHASLVLEELRAAAQYQLAVHPLDPLGLWAFRANFAFGMLVMPITRGAHASIQP